MSAVATRARAKYIDAPASKRTRWERPVATTSSAVTTHSAPTPAPRPTTAWAADRARVVPPASSSSQRPASSSPRTRRVLVASPHTAPSSVQAICTLKTVKPATVWSWWAGPKSALVALEFPKAASRRSLDRAVL